MEPVLKNLTPHLSEYYDDYAPICANSIVVSALEHLSGTVLETKDVCEMKLHQEATSWPYFLREKTGTARATMSMDLTEANSD